MQTIRSTISSLRDRYAPASHTSTFRDTGKITPEEFVLAGDYLVYKFPTWSWADAESESRRYSYLPPGKQYLVTRGVPCRKRLDDHFAGDAELDELVRDELRNTAKEVGGDGEDDGWLQTGGDKKKDMRSSETRMRDVRTMDESGNVGPQEPEEDDIPDMEDDEDDAEAIIRDQDGSNTCSLRLRTYTLYITYTSFYSTPRMYLSGYLSPSEPLPPQDMMQDIVGDYKDKTVTLEDFPFYDHSVKMASVHPCRHASVMKVLLDRADAALKLRLQKLAHGNSSSDDAKVESGMEGLVDDAAQLSLKEAQSKKGHNTGVAAAGGNGGDEWEVLDDEEEKVAIRVDQYLVVFLKFIASVTPGIEHDFTMGV
ncbi:MAG: hypothetical protein Q9227_002957 [Pyrenula ochraceoflavens]